MWHTLTNHPAHQKDGEGESSTSKDDKKQDDKKQDKPKDEPKKSDSTSG